MEYAVKNFRVTNPRDRYGLLAFLAYLSIALALFGPPLLRDFRGVHAGLGEDSTIYMWDLAWWPFAIGRHLNPFYTRYIWAPLGINLTWTTSIPLPSILMWPVTASFGPVASFNVLTLLAAPLAGWSAFLLCRHISKSWWPSLLGGYIFAFTNGELIHVLGSQMQMSLIFLVPLVALVVARAIDGKIGTGALVAALSALLAALCLISIELLATMTFFGAVTIVIAWLFAPAGPRQNLVRSGIPMLSAYAVAAVIVSPFVYWLVMVGAPHGPIVPAQAASLDLLQFGGYGKPPPNLPMLAIAAFYAWQKWRTRTAKVLLVSFITISTFALGPRLHVDRVALFPLPGVVIAHLPLIDKAIPARFGLYSILILGIIVATWLVSNGLSKSANLAVAAIVVSFTVPGLLSRGWHRPAAIPTFFTNGMYRRYLTRDENVLVIPFGWRGDSMLWQAAAGMYFRMAGGYMVAHPEEFDRWPIRRVFYWRAYMPDAPEQLAAFMAHHQIATAIVADSDLDARWWNGILPALASTEHHVGGVAVYRVSPSALAPYHDVTAAQMRRRAGIAAIDSLVLAAGQWLSSGHKLENLTAYTALQAGLLKPSWCAGEKHDLFTGMPVLLADPHSDWFCFALLSGRPDGRRLVVGLLDRYANLGAAAARYRGAANHIYFPYPHDLLSPGAATPPAGRQAALQMEFAPGQIPSLAARLRPVPEAPPPGAAHPIPP
ncbi:MAG: hypothetical protein ACREQI_09155 [Candidatus Binataceae bacterium]